MTRLHRGWWQFSKARACFRAFGVLGVITPAFTAFGETSPSTELSWSAPSTCPGEDALRAEVERMLGQTLAARRDQKLRIEGSVRGDARTGFAAALRVTSARGTQTRQLSNADCAKLTEAAALVIALAIDPKLVVPPTVAAPAGTGAEDGMRVPNGAPTTEPAKAAATTTESPSNERSNAAAASAETAADSGSFWRFSGAAIGLVSGGALPGAAFGAGARLSAGSGPFGVLVHGAYFFPKLEPVPETAASGIELDLWRVGAAVCGVPIAGTLTLTGCVGPVVGSMSGSGTGVDQASTESDRWSALLAEGTLSYVSNVGLTAIIGAEVGPALERPRFGLTLDGDDVELFRASGWVASGFLGVGFSK
jgi:hypothetical protein